MDWALILIVVAALAGQLAFRGFRSRVTGGKFALRTDGACPVLETQLGIYRFDGKAQKVFLQRPDGFSSFIKLGDVRGVQTRVGYKTAALEEIFLEGWNFTDLHSDYKDHRMHWDIVMTTAHGVVPLARLTQYKKRDWFDLATPLQHAILERLGYYRDGALVAAELEAAAKGSLRAVGLNILGGYGAIAPSGALDGAPLPTDADLPENRPTVAPPRAAPLPIDLPPPPDNPRWKSVGGEGSDSA